MASENREQKTSPSTKQQQEPSPEGRRTSAQGSGVDRPAPMSGYRTMKRPDAEDYLPEASGLSGADMPNAPHGEGVAGQRTEQGQGK